MKTKDLIDGLLTRSLQHLPEAARKALEDLRAKAGDDDTDAAPVLAAVGDALRAGHEHGEALSAFRAAGVDSLETARALKASGEDGKAYRKDLIAEALRHGVAAQGDAFPEETYRKVLEDGGRSIEDIKNMSNAWKAAAAERLGQLDNEGDPTKTGKPTGKGGRSTVPLHGFENNGSGGGARRPASTTGFKTGRK